MKHWHISLYLFILNVYNLQKLKLFSVTSKMLQETHPLISILTENERVPPLHKLFLSQGNSKNLCKRKFQSIFGVNYSKWVSGSVCSLMKFLQLLQDIVKKWGWFFLLFCDCTRIEEFGSCTRIGFICSVILVLTAMFM